MEKKLTVLVIAPFCYPPASAEALVTLKFVLAALHRNWKVDVIGRSDIVIYYPSDEGDLWKDVVKVISPVSGNLLPANGILAKLASRLSTPVWGLRATCQAVRLARKNRYDLVMSRATPAYGHLPALILSLLRNIPWMACWSDPLPQRKAPPPYGVGPHAGISLFYNWFLSSVARRANWHAFPCERLKDYYARYLPKVRGKSIVLPHIALGSLREGGPQTKQFTLCHTGSLTHRSPEKLFQAIKAFIDKTGNTLSVRFVGGAADLDVQRLASRYGIERIVTNEPFRSFQETRGILSESTVLMIIEAECEEGIYFPSKFVDYVQTGKPVLALSPRVGTLSDMLSSGGGIAADCASVESIEQAISTLYSAWREGMLDTRYGSAKLFDMFQEDNVLQQVARLIEAPVIQ